MKRRIIFLDIDGVLNQHYNTTDRHMGFVGIDHRNVAVFNKLVKDTGAKIVVSSTWRTMHPIDELREIFKQYKIECEIIDYTIQCGPIRGVEIEEWLSRQEEMPSYVIIDDNSDMGDLMPRLVQTPWDEGLRQVDAEKVVKMFEEQEK